MSHLHMATWAVIGNVNPFTLPTPELLHYETKFTAPGMLILEVLNMALEVEV